jgi:hypothetical protein
VTEPSRTVETKYRIAFISIVVHRACWREVACRLDRYIMLKRHGFDKKRYYP